MKARAVAQWRVAFVVLALALLAPPSYARLADAPDLAQAGAQRLGDGDSSDRSGISAKTAANGLQIVGNLCVLYFR